MGFVSLMGMVNPGFMGASGFVGMYPEKKPVTFDITLLMGSQGFVNAACTTE